MTARESSAAERAIKLVQKGHTLSEAARLADCALSTVRRAMRRRGEPPRTVPSGPAHSGYIDGRTARKKKA